MNSQRSEWLYDPDLTEDIKEVAHGAYHQHNEECGCRTVGHLTAFIALEVRSAIAAARDGKGTRS